MNEQSEHLTDAQIESYGEVTSDAGRESDAVEEHLARCPACRERLLTFHRADMGLLEESGAAGSTLPVSSGLPDVSGPNLLRDQNENTTTTSACRYESDLRDLVAGIYPEDKAPVLIRHVVTCDRCGALLRAYVEDFSEDLSEEEEALLQKTRGALPEWHKQTARKIMKAWKEKAGESGANVQFQGKEVPPKRDLAIDETQARTVPGKTDPPLGSTARQGTRTFSWKWVLIPATAAACGLIALGIWYQQRDTPEKVEKLLAQAYTEQRTMEMRIPLAKHSDFTQQRSGETRSLLDSPASLRKAADVIATHLERRPDDPKWLMLSARFDILEWNYKSALLSLDRIRDEGVLKSPEFLITRSLALYQKSAVLKEAQGYFEAIDLLGRALQKTPNDRIALYNRAIGCEKVLAYECAIGDWKHFLDIETDPSWSAEARRYLNEVEEKKTLAH